MGRRVPCGAPAVLQIVGDDDEGNPSVATTVRLAPPGRWSAAGVCCQPYLPSHACRHQLSLQLAQVSYGKRHQQPGSINCQPHVSTCNSLALSGPQQDAFGSGHVASILPCPLHHPAWWRVLAHAARLGGSTCCSLISLRRLAVLPMLPHPGTTAGGVARHKSRVSLWQLLAPAGFIACVDSKPLINMYCTTVLLST